MVLALSSVVTSFLLTHFNHAINFYVYHLSCLNSDNDREVFRSRTTSSRLDWNHPRPCPLRCLLHLSVVTSFWLTHFNHAINFYLYHLSCLNSHNDSKVCLSQRTSSRMDWTSFRSVSASLTSALVSGHKCFALTTPSTSTCTASPGPASVRNCAPCCVVTR